MYQLPAGLVEHKQFILWRLEQRGTGKALKVPINPRAPAYPANAMDPGIWLGSDEALAYARQLGHGYNVGFVFTEQDPFYFIDIDDALSAEGVWSPVAQQLVAAFPGAAIEVSQSGKGLHIFGSGPVPEHGCKNKAFKLELYHADRFVALTGYHAQGSALQRNDAAIQWLVESYFKRGAPGVELDDVTVGPVPEWRGPTDDDELVRRAMQSRSARSMFSTNAACFADLWQANAEVLARAYPSSSGDVWDRSTADQALMQHLAFWTGKDGERMLRLMARSSLRREKWDKHRSYLRTTCINALQLQGDVCRDKEPEPVAALAAEGMTAAQTVVTGNTFMSPTEQAKLFENCVYVYDDHGILVPGGEVLDAGRFRVMFGGYTFAMDNANQRTVRNAFEAFTESQMLRPARVNTTCFRPDLKPGAIVVESGRSAVNTWWPITVPMQEGDVTPFLMHLRKLLPNERDAVTLLSYMAACVQHKGIKFQWAPLLQGVEGNGKTFFSYCVMNAVSMRYCHMPRPMDISSKFNPWLKGKLVIAIEDVYKEHDDKEIFEILKPMITGRMQPVEPKGVDQVMAEICCNFIFNSNHKDGVRKTPNDRRIAPLFTAQQAKSHLARDGMGKGYFVALWNWYEKGGGMAIVNHLLQHYPIAEEFNPALGGIAPETSSTAEAIEQSLGTVEQVILETIEQHAVGFMAGWVSSIYLDKLLEAKGLARRVPLNRRRDLMRSIGYDYHPALSDGRVNNTLLPDAGKPRLYVRAGHEALALQAPAEVARAYSAAQMPVGFGGAG